MFVWYVKLKDKIWWNWIFFSIVCLFCLISFVLDSSSLIDIISVFWSMLIKILPTLLLVYFIIFGFNLIISNKKIVKFLEKGSYIKKLLFSVIFGILSSWPIYLRYGLLKQLQNVGLSLGHIATFSYARAIKLPLLPIMISYFGFKFSIIFVWVLFFFSFFQALIVDLILIRE
jgi:uncharacterized membrane protein YraQ (UPF0718 family)